MPYSCLPTYPLILFGIIEPALLIWAYTTGMRDPVRFFSDQAPNHTLAPTCFNPQAEALTLQMLNVLLLLAPMALVCCWNINTPTTKWYLMSVAVADLGHVYATYRGVGRAYFITPAGWNNLVWGNVGVSAFLHVNRLMTLIGVFG
ncbi:hypothetical protein DOTSEDRAFT_112227, partial [Dothistroma septosporum NZE10]